MDGSTERQRIPEAGQYLGEISALTLVHLPSQFTSLPFLLAGTGSEVLLFDISLGRLKKSFPVFSGIRVHGISCDVISRLESHLNSKAAIKIAVYGERRIKLFSLQFHLVLTSEDELEVHTDLILLQVLPMFSHWILDVCFFEDIHNRLAVGCSDNSVHIWDIQTSSLVFDIRCPERCLLYSMRLFTGEVKAVRVASGTIFNEIVIWEAVHCCSSQTLPCKMIDADKLNSAFIASQCVLDRYEANIICRLAGHQGSIFRLSWSSDGSKLVSVSDDRSARIWSVHGVPYEMQNGMNVTCHLGEFSSPYKEGRVLFGHSARVWDCCIHESLIITAGEDCTCRIWGMYGEELNVIKEHTGKGIWRCVYDPGSSVLVTAGFDSAIKVHQLLASLSRSPLEYTKDPIEGKEEFLTLRIPNSSAHIRPMDSKSEYVRCLHFAMEDEIYVATNHGFVFHANVCWTGTVKWTELIRVSGAVPIICMDLFSKQMLNHSHSIQHWIAVGDGEGSLTVVKVVIDGSTPKVSLKISWQAELERQLLGTYWSKALGNGYIFTSDPRGSLKLWKLSDNSVGCCNVSLIGEFKSPFSSRIMCVDVLVEKEVLICGDLRGNLVLFPLFLSMLHGVPAESGEKVLPVTCFKGAHGISTVSSISFSRFSSGLVEIYSTGGDGCVCYLEYDKFLQTLEFVGMKKVKELSLIQSVYTPDCSIGKSVDGDYAVGFSSTDFLIWNMATETKVMDVKCGGWRRPHAYYIGQTPEINSKFAFVKDNLIYIRRHQILDGERNVIPRNLHQQFHGRELHSMCFITEEWQRQANLKHKNLSNSCWIATGCEDGTVRLTRYNPGAQSWSFSKLLGEHVGGSAVRSICCVYRSSYAANTNLPNVASKQRYTIQRRESPFLLVSVGAKRVLTSWLLKCIPVIVENASINCLSNESDSPKSAAGNLSSMTFKWLSTDMPNRRFCNQKEAREGEKLEQLSKDISGIVSDVSSVSLDPKTDKRELKVNSCSHIHDNDWRYLAVTAFLVELEERRLLICFVVVACSDATLTLRALVLPYRYWFDVAILAPLCSPVLSLQHVVVPLRSMFGGGPNDGSMYVVISGSTDGSIAFWDLSDSVEAFMQRVSSLHLQKPIDCQKRPKTGRGSQGGRWWRSIEAPVKTDMFTDESGSPRALDSACSEENSDDSLSKCLDITPFHVMNNVHQSGVNCLHVSVLNHFESVESGSQFHIVSGGDDQAVGSLLFELVPASSSLGFADTGANMDAASGNSDIVVHCQQKHFSRIRIICQEKIASAHSSAVKGVWTDGTWVFSAGLDQRVRCWHLQENGKLIEYSHMIISVPEPESLDARACGSNKFQVAVAGRGMQVVEFTPPNRGESRV